MKKIILIFSVLLIAVCVNAQFFSPADQVMKQKSSVKFGEPGSPWLMRPYFELTAAAVSFGGGKPVVNTLNSMGLGFSYGKYSILNDKAYCNYSFNLGLLTQIELNGEISTQLGGVLSVDVFDKLVGAGLGLINKKPMLLLTLSYSF